jgi:hypothetical protein
MPDRKIKRQRHPAKSFSKSPLSLYFLAPSCLSGYKSIMQNKPNFKMGKIDTSTATLKSYANEHRTMSNERYQKQTQSNPIPPSHTPSPNRITASRPMEDRQFCRYRLKTLQIRVFAKKRRIERFWEGLWAVRGIQKRGWECFSGLLPQGVCFLYYKYGEAKSEN